MYKPQIRKKINKGKGYEVLRNKIVKNFEDKGKLEKYMSTIFDEDIEFIIKDPDNKDNIRLYVKSNGKESAILSQGSGFLQVAEIFSSLDFYDAELYVLLIDEPDSHIHLSQQRKLVQEFRNIEKSQLFVISHNERFIENASDNEILFVNERDIANGVLCPLTRGAKKFVIENLVGEYNDIDKLKNSNRILMVEGFKDKERIESLLSKHSDCTGINVCDLFIFEMGGIDAVVDKLPSIVSAYSQLIDRDIEWILLRDTDCIPVCKIESVKKENMNLIHHPNKTVIFQEGYEFESSLFSDMDTLRIMISSYYDTKNQISISDLNVINQQIISEAHIFTSDIHKKLLCNLDRQKKIRKDRVYKNLSLEEFLHGIEIDTIQYILCKDIIDVYLRKVHEKVNNINCNNVTESALNSQSLFKFYVDSINSIQNFHPAHIEIIDKLLPS